ncbi:LRR receptor kinase SERK2 [Dendrobium catenatum]|uniref:LRR receptor kinase SERK2 n=1 Tax=Dendrobium catenatum TaxID=906689 RepID=UPI0009F61C02|nr:LRR receptor kinase SERK2 [Dendrobium catenatum]
MGFILCHYLLFLLLLLLLSFCHLEVVRGNAELEALMEVKAALDPEGRFLSSWAVGEAPCAGTFVGVACNERGQVANISLQGKGLSGSISPAVARLKSLSGLYLHYNAISGSVPKEISSLTQLSDLYLNVNNLSGNIPEEIGGMINLQVLQLGYNQLTGSIPIQLGLLKKLTVISLQYNRLNGAIPASLGDLAQLSWMDLSFNQLFGSIPVKLSQISQLYVLDLRNNSLSGNVPSELKILNERFKYANNSDLCGAGFPSLRLCTAADILNPKRTDEPYGPHSPQDIPLSANITSECNGSLCSKSSESPITASVIGVIVILVTGTTLGLLAFTSWYLKRRQINNSGLLQGFELKINHGHPNEIYRRRASPLASLEYSTGWDPLAEGRCGVGFSKEVSQDFIFNLEEIECATQYFSEANLIKKSNFSATYRGLLRDGAMVAVKSISKTSCKSEEAEFLKGLKILTKLQHENLLRLRGFCCSRARGECFLVYDFISNGKLSQYLDVKSEENGWFLDWPSRVTIIRGIAKGIEYLHSSSAKANKSSMVHQNISADKILLDNNFNPYVTGCGLYKLLADDVVFSTLKANAAMGYLAPEYTAEGRLTEKSDIYAFGMIVFQILMGKKRVSHLKFVAEDDTIKDIIDEKLRGNFSKPEASKLADIALLCTSDVPSQRPTMETVLKELTFAMG